MSRHRSPAWYLTLVWGLLVLAMGAPEEATADDSDRFWYSPGQEQRLKDWLGKNGYEIIGGNQAENFLIASQPHKAPIPKPNLQAASQAPATSAAQGLEKCRRCGSAPSSTDYLCRPILFQPCAVSSPCPRPGRPRIFAPYCGPYADSRVLVVTPRIGYGAWCP